MSNEQTLIDVLTERATSQNSVTLINGQHDETILTYGELYKNALRRLHVLQSQGIKPGDQLIMLIGETSRFLDVFWACLLGGIVPVPVSGGNSEEHRRKLFLIDGKLGTSWLYTSQSAMDRLEKFSLDQQEKDSNPQYGTDAFADLQRRTLVLEQDQGSQQDGVAHDIHPDDTAFIQFSSGSTSAPKGVVVTHRNLLTNINDILNAMQMRAEDRMLSWMPLTHDMGLIGFHLTPVVAGIDHLIMPTDLFVRRPGLWMEKASAHRISLLCSPNFGYQHYLKSFSAAKAEGLDLRCVRLVFNGAEPISAEICERFMETLSPYGLAYQAMYPVYGLAEATLAVAFPVLHRDYQVIALDRSSLTMAAAIKPAGTESSDTVRFVSVGRPVEHCEVKIANDDYESLDDSVVGHICIRGEAVTQGYYGEDELNASVFDAEGWLDTGDLGFMHDGNLYVTGRAKDIVFVNGQNFYPHDLEELVTLGGVSEFGKVAVSSYRDASNTEDKVVCFVQSRGDAADFADTAALASRIINQSTGVVTENVVAVPRIPKTTSGKVQRFRLIEAYLQGEFGVMPETNGNETVRKTAEATSDSSGPGLSSDATISARLQAICQSQVEEMTVAPEDNLFEIGISSLTLARIHADIEEYWPDQVDITDLFDYPSIETLGEFLEAKLAEKDVVT